jgi:hypothetical protein
LVIHFPEIYHLFCLWSLIPEDEERTFGDLRSISEKQVTDRLLLLSTTACVGTLPKRKEMIDLRTSRNKSPW